MVEFFGTVGRALRGGGLLVALAGSVAVLLVAACGALAAEPVLDPSIEPFSCSVKTPCEGRTSWSPGRLAVNEKTGDVYVIDKENNVVDVFSATGVYQRDIPDPSGESHESFSFGGEDDVAVDNSGGPNEGRVYVVSENATTVFAFNPAGGFLWQSKENLEDSCGVAVDNSGKIWSADFKNGLQERDLATGAATGSPILAESTTCHFAFDATGNIIANRWQNNLEKYDSKGIFLQLIAGEGAKYFDVATDSSNSAVYGVAEASVTRFDDAGNPLDSFGSGVVGSPAGVTVNGPARRAYVSDSTSNDVKIYDLPPLHKLDVSREGTGTGTVGSDPAGIDCGAGCSHEFEEGEKVTLTATADAHNKFTGWSGACSGAAVTCQVTIGAADASVTATFKATPPHALTVTKEGSGAGEVSSIPAAIECGAVCEITLDEEEIIALKAVAAVHSKFTGWSGCDVASGTNCGVTMGASARQIVATFTHDKPVVVTTAGATGISQHGASVAGTVNPEGALVSDCHVEYGTTTAYGAQTPCASSPGEGASPVSVGATLSGLTAGTTYHFRVVATNSGGPANGADQSFDALADTCATNAALCPPTEKTCLTDASLCSPPPPPPVTCVVPKLAGKTLGQARSALGAAHCAVGKVSKPKAGKGKKLGSLVVKSSSPAAGARLAKGAKVNLKLAQKPRRKH